jgi:hypothetical protein
MENLWLKEDYMKKRVIMAMAVVMTVLLVFPAAAQEASQSTPMNTVTVDIGPTIIGGAMARAGSIIGGDSGISSSGFGIGASYERQIFDKLSVGGRFAYLGAGVGMTNEYSPSVKASLSMKLSSFSLEGHVRYYPWAGTFYLDGMLGYAKMSMKFSGEVFEAGSSTKIDASLSMSRSYFKLGAKVGWRIDFGEPGGFIFEPSFGYYAGIGLGDTMGKRFSNGITGNPNMGDLDTIFKYIEQLIFVGGPRLSLAFGWRF